MIVLIAAQIFLAFLPGEPLELAAGFLFGSVGGTLLCLVGSLLGTALVYLLVQRYGKRLVTVFFKQEQLNEFTGVLKKRNSMLWIFLLLSLIHIWDVMQALSIGLDTLTTAGVLALGILVVSTIMKAVFKPERRSVRRHVEN